MPLTVGMQTRSGEWKSGNGKFLKKGIERLGTKTLRGPRLDTQGKTRIEQGNAPAKPWAFK